MHYVLGIIAVIAIGYGVYYYAAEEPQTAAENYGNSMTETEDSTMNTSNSSDTPMLDEIAPGVAVAPISHASAVFAWGDEIIVADPVGVAEQYLAYGQPDVVFVTHRHGDHLDPDTLAALLTPEMTFIAPQDVLDQLPDGVVANVVVMAPGDIETVGALTYEAIPAYNVRPEAQDFHPQARGDIGLILSDGTSRVYVAGDTEGTPEMRALTDIDVAFIPMNLPYTMGVEDAADAVLAFAPAHVYPYHFRTPEGLSDIGQFEALLAAGNPEIAVTILDWYEAEE